MLATDTNFDTLVTFDSDADSVLWQNGRLTNYGVQVYTQGDCWALAWELHKLESAPIFLVPTNGGKRKCDWIHVLVQVGPDHYLDAFGLQNLDEVKSRWGHKPVPLARDHSSWTAYNASLGHGASEGWVYSPELSTATAIAELLIDTHL